MRLTRRGWVVGGVVALALGLSWSFGPRSLNAVAGPLVAALLVGAVQLVRADSPDVEDGGVRTGFPGDERVRRLSVEGSGVATLTATLPAGLGGATVERTVTLPATVEQPIRFDARGVYDLDGIEVRHRDALGLFADVVAVPVAEPVVVYPAVHSLGGDRLVARLFAANRETERQTFDRLREYVPGDPLRNVHWKASAKHDEYKVVEFAPERRTESVTIVAGTEPGEADAMATAVASLFVAVLDAGLPAGVTVPAGHLPAGSGDAHREEGLRLLARTGSGEVDDEHDAADISVTASFGDVRVRVGDDEFTFAELVGDGYTDRDRREVVA